MAHIGRTVLVSGAAGSLGQRLVPVLTAEGWRVRALIHRRDAPGSDEEVRGDLLDPPSLIAACSGVQAIVHLAALTHARSPSAYKLVNETGTSNLLEAAAASAVERFVHVSTRAISPEGGAYSASKAAAEELVASSSLEFSIIRLPDVYGGNGREGVERIIEQAREGRPILIVGEGRHEICPIHVDDVLPALAAAASAPAAARKTYTLAGPCLTVEEFARACVAQFGSNSRLIRIPEPLVAVVARAASFLPLPIYPDQLARLTAPKPALSPEARADLGFLPRPFSALDTSRRNAGTTSPEE